MYIYIYYTYPATWFVYVPLMILDAKSANSASSNPWVAKHLVTSITSDFYEACSHGFNGSQRNHVLGMQGSR